MDDVSESEPWFDSWGWLRRRIPDAAVRECSARGDVTEAVFFWCDELKFSVPQQRAREYLLDTGGWDEEDIAAMPDKDVAWRILWLACCSLNEQTVEGESDPVFMLE